LPTGLALIGVAQYEHPREKPSPANAKGLQVLFDATSPRMASLHCQ
jgi:hypothetical protein